MEPGISLMGRYRLERLIGTGGMGQVWAAHDTVLGRDVAVKVQRFDRDGDASASERFVREARTAAALQHPNVVTIFDSGTEGDTALLVMELLPGPTLDAFVAQHGPLPEPQAVALAAQISAGLAAAHGAGVVHRDIKPSNLMFDAHGTLKVLDFGIALLAQTAAARLTATNTVIGSPAYLSPEQLQGGRADERSDLYALGCVMMMMLTGAAPFSGEHALALVHQHVNVAPPPVSARRPGIGPALDALVAQMLSKSPQGRPRTALEVLERLSALQSAWSTTGPVTLPAERPPIPPATTRAMTPATTRAMTHPEVLGQAATRVLPTPDAARSAPRSRRRSIAARWLAAGIALVGVVTVLVLAVTGVTDRPSADQPPTSRSAPASAPSPRASTSAATPSTAQASGTDAPLQEALVNLRAAVRAVVSDGQIEAKKAEELSKRVDELSRHLTEEPGKDQVKKLDDLDKYLEKLSDKGELTSAGRLRIEAALRAVRDVVGER